MPMQNKFVEIRKIARELPHSPGVYLMKDRLGSVIYVGKAKDLRKELAVIFKVHVSLSGLSPKLERWWKWLGKSLRGYQIGD